MNIDQNIFITVSIIWAIAAITPGPNFFITVQTAIGETRRLSFFTVLGIVTGTFVWATSGYLGVAILFNTVPLVYYSIKLIGALYLIYIGFNLIFRTNITRAPHQMNNSLSAIQSFRLGVFTNLLNPKTAAFMTSLFAATIPPTATIQTGIACIVLICSISAAWYSLVATLFSLDRAKNRYKRSKRLIEQIAGSIFVFFGIKLALSE